MATSSVTTPIPGFVAGTWTIDPVHTDISFTVRHMMVSKVRGHFTKFEGTIKANEDPSQSSVSVTIDVASVNTNNEMRDNHMRSKDFFDVEHFPTATFASTGIRSEGGKFWLDGNLTLHGITKPVTLAVEPNGFAKDPYGKYRGGASAKGEINRQDFGITIVLPMDGGGVVVGDTVTLTIEIEATLNTD